MSTENSVLKALQQEIDSLLLSIIKIAHGYKIQEDGEVWYDPRSTVLPDSVEFDEDTLISFEGMDATGSGGTYFLEFTTLGQLSDILTKHGFEPVINATLLNLKLHYDMTLDEDSDLNRLFSEATAKKKKGSRQTAQSLMSAKEDLQKFLVMYKMKLG